MYLKSITVFVCLFSFWVGTDVLQARENTEECTYYFRGDNFPNGDIREFLTQDSNSDALLVCRGSRGDEYYAVSSLRRYEGVKYYYETKIYKTLVDGKTYWELLPSDGALSDQPISVVKSRYMCLESIGCPSQDQNGYVYTSGITIGAFRALARSWEAWKRHRKVMGVIDHSGSSKSDISVSFLSFRTALQNDDQIALRAISFSPGDEFEMPSYALLVESGDSYWSVSVDVVEREAKILGVGSVIH